MDFYTSCERRGNDILVLGYADGNRVKERVKFEPYLFIGKETGTFKDIHGNTAIRKDFATMKDAKEFGERYSEVPGIDLYGFSSWQHLYIYDEFTSVKAQADHTAIHVVNLDIETDSENGYGQVDIADKQITAITISRNGKKAVFGMFPYDSSDDTSVTYYECPTEIALLQKFLRIWNSPFYSPDVISGWHIDGYDIPYLINRITRVLGKKEADKLSPWGLLSTREIVTMGKTQVIHTIVGITSLDYMELYRKFIVPRDGQPESFRLDFIGELILGERKLDYSEYGDLATLYKKDYQKFIRYNIRDVALIDKLDEKLKLIDLAITMSYDAGCNFNDIFGTVKPWDCRIHQYLRERNIVIPYKQLSDLDFSYEGGYVKDPIVGMYNWPCSVDLASSYPNQVWQYNIGPETFVDQLEGITVEKLLNREIDVYQLTENGRYTMTANGCRFRKDNQSFMSALMEQNFTLRKVYKKKMIESSIELKTVSSFADIRRLEFEVSKYDNLQHGMKIGGLNSFYGSLANAYNRWFDPRFAEAITLSGQLAVRTAEKAINAYLNKLLRTDIDRVIAIDTDSCYVNMSDLVVASWGEVKDIDRIVDFLDKVFKEKITPMLEKAFQELADYMQCNLQRMDMKREIIGEKGIWTGKKHYMIRVWDKEGVRYKIPETKLVGIEAIRSSTPSAARKRIKEAIEIILDGDEKQLHEFVGKTREEFKVLPLEEIAFPRGANDLEKWTDPKNIFAKSTPIAVKGALLHNHLLNQLGITEFSPIQSGEKIKFIYLKKFNQFNFTVISFANILPPQFKLDDQVDRIEQFNKGFIAPIKSICDVIGFSPEKIATLDQFFVD